MVGRSVRTVDAAHRVWCANSRPIMFFKVIHFIHAFEKVWRTIKHAESSESDGLVDSGRKLHVSKN
jgi:hypothetical protein